MDDLPRKRGQGLTPVGFSDYGIESFHHNHRRQGITLTEGPGMGYSIPWPAIQYYFSAGLPINPSARETDLQHDINQERPAY
jgi:hypothetical protein